MGKKARKTRWRALAIDDNARSDSEESNTTTAPRLPKSYQQKSYYNKFSYSSQSTPRRRYQHDSTKSTRSSSTASENKITFNEDEYTRITTPRQDVLFKKGYLNKPKNYQTQTSTGTSTTSTGNSTGNGTPDHQSTDMEYESQFVFPNGFVDQNGIYYVNSYESYPLMFYNPPTYYTELSNNKSKRYSTGSLTESMSPNNEEATSQDLSGGEASNNVSDYSGHHLYNVVYPGYYVNEVGSSQDTANREAASDQQRRIKKRKRRKSSKSQTAQDSSEYTEDESSCGDAEEDPKVQMDQPTLQANSHIITAEQTKPVVVVEDNVNGVEDVETCPEAVEAQANIQQTTEEMVTEQIETTTALEQSPEEEDLDVPKNESSSEVHPKTSECTETTAEDIEPQPETTSADKLQKSDLKPDAEEFIPRAFRNEIPIGPNVQFIKVPPNFVPIPMVPLGDFNGQSFNSAFIPPGIPINFLPPDPKMFPNYLGFVPNVPFVQNIESETIGKPLVDADTEPEVDHTCDNSTTATDVNHQNDEPTEKPLVQNLTSKVIDITAIVHKLEEAAKEQEDEEAKQTMKSEESQSSPRRRIYENKHFRQNKYKNNSNYRRSHYNNPQNSPQKNPAYIPEDSPTQNTDQNTSKEDSSVEEKREAKVEATKDVEHCNGVSTIQTQDNQKPPQSRKHWKSYTNGNLKWQQNGIAKDYRPRQNGKLYNENDIKEVKANQTHKNYSSMLRNKLQSEPKNYDNYNREKPKGNFESPKKEMKIDSPKDSPVKVTNQWISVSNRKKRKGKNVEENDASFDDHFEDKEDQQQNDGFECYDVNQLVDVELITNTEAEEEVLKIETSQEDLAENRSFPEANPINVSMIHVSELEKQLITQSEVVEADNLIIEEDPVKQEENAEESMVEKTPEISAAPTQQEESKYKSKQKKSKKGVQKLVTKRVIITDVDISMKCEDIKKPIRKVVTRLIDVKTANEKIEEEKIEEETIQEEVPKTVEEEEKKKAKKKKRKPIKDPMSTSSLSSSNTTINNVDDSYDFLLDTALCDDSVEKTNIEISQELDKIIQKGMYNSLEEKMKSLNINESDGFFKSIFSKITSRESSVEKGEFSGKTPDLSKILQSSSTLFKPSSVSQETYFQNKEINKILPDLESPAEDGIFLETPDLTENLHNQTVTKDIDCNETELEDPNRDKKHIHGGDVLDVDTQPKTLYPITQAVKEWMCKTRETTPDVEILKSPRAIYKEFCDSGSETDTEVGDLKNLSLEQELSTSLDDDEVTIFIKGTEPDSKKGSVEQPDIEYWESDLEVPVESSEIAENHCLSETDCLNKHIEQGEDIMEVYESKYGKNEDYLNLQKEIRDKKNNMNYPKHGNLPYRAICCSIM